MNNENLTSLTWSDLTLESKGHEIIKKESGFIKEGTMTALLGTSGAGKTSLLNALAGRVPDSITIKGNILINNQKRNVDSWTRSVAYVEQFFYAYENQSVYETIKFSSMLKTKFSDENNDDGCTEDDVNNIIKLLGLNPVKNNYLNEISGGELKRVSIGIELIGNPRILFLDEPTSGLDSFNALNTIQILKKLSLSGKIILLTIHQPSYLITDLFDRIFIMTQGNSVFQGNMNKCIGFFEKNGLTTPEKTNPCDYFLDMISLDQTINETATKSQQRINTLINAWKNKVNKHKFLEQDSIESKSMRSIEDDDKYQNDQFEKTNMKKIENQSNVNFKKDQWLNNITNTNETENENYSEETNGKNLDLGIQKKDDKGENEIIIEKNFLNEKSNKIKNQHINKEYYEFKSLETSNNNLEESNIKCKSKNSYNLFKIIARTSFPILFSRNMKELWRDKKYIKIQIIQKIVFILLLGLSYLQLGYSADDIQSRTGVIFFILINSLFSTAGPIFNVFPEEKKIIVRERKSGLYNGFSAYISKLISLMIFNAFFSIFYITSVYWMVGLNPNAGRFFIYLIIQISALFFSISLGLTIGTLAPTQTFAQLSGTTILIVFIIFGGGFNNPGTIPGWLRWIIWISPVNYAFRASMQNQYRGLDFDGTQGEEVVIKSGFEKVSTWGSIFTLWGLTLFWILLGATTLHYITRIRLKLNEY